MNDTTRRTNRPCPGSRIRSNGNGRGLGIGGGRGPIGNPMSGRGSIRPTSWVSRGIGRGRRRYI